MYEIDFPVALAALAALVVPFVPVAPPPMPYGLLLVLAFALLRVSAPPLPA